MKSKCQENLRSLFLILAGALISVIASIYIRRICGYTILVILSLLIVFLLFYGFGLISPLHFYNKLRRRFLPQVVILSDMDWDPSNKEIYTWTNISPKDWKNTLEQFGREKGVKLKTEFITTNTVFYPYLAIINPYGGVYPEIDLRSFKTMNKILDYVSKGGMFINIADIPCYYAYSPLIRRRLDTTPPVYGIERQVDGKISITQIRPFELTPLMQKLGVNVLNTETSDLHVWDVEFEDKFAEVAIEIGAIMANRVAVVERNVEPIIRPKQHTTYAGTKLVTPLFFVNYGKGRFLISLTFEDQLQNRHIMRDMIAQVIAKSIEPIEKAVEG